MDYSEIKASMKEIEGAASADRLVEVLQMLDQRFKPTEQLLRETKLGVAVNKLRTHSDSRVTSLVKKMVSKWKEQVQQQKLARAKAKASAAAGASASAGKPARVKSSAADDAGANAASADAAPAKSSVLSSMNGAAHTSYAGKPRSFKADFQNTQVHSDKVRNSCVEVTYNALAVDSSHPPEAILRAAKEIEAAVFVAENGTTAAYRTKLRSLFMNLKDPKNPELRERVVTAEISGERLRTMTPQEMAPSELKQAIQQMEKRNLFNAQGAKETRATTDRFTCGKCKQKKVSYYQMQTRSADEPLTTFCTCENCGNRWKFS